MSLRPAWATYRLCIKKQKQGLAGKVFALQAQRHKLDPQNPLEKVQSWEQDGSPGHGRQLAQPTWGIPDQWEALSQKYRCVVPGEVMVTARRGTVTHPSHAPGVSPGLVSSSLCLPCCPKQLVYASSQRTKQRLPLPLALYVYIFSGIGNV